MDILARYKNGESIRHIARELNLSRNTIRRYIRNKKQYPNYNLTKKRSSFLDNYKSYIQDRINAARPEWIPATVIFKEIKAQGYKGQISLLRNYLRTLKPHKEEEPIIRFETPKAQQVQIDFVTTSIGKKQYKAFVATLGYSRYCYVEFFENEKAESWMLGLEHAFEYFGGVTKEVLCDNAKALVVSRDEYGPGKHRFNDQFLDLSKKYGFVIKTCRPYRAKTKGKVERFNSYLKHSFIIPLLTAFKQANLEIDINTLNYKVKTWLNNEANCRVHATLLCRPLELFEQEKTEFKSLPIFTSEDKQSSPIKTQQELSIETISSNNSQFRELIEIQPSADIFNSLISNIA